MKNNKNITRKQLVEVTKKNVSTITRAIQVLKAKGYIERVGSDRSGYWKIIK